MSVSLKKILDEIKQDFMLESLSIKEQIDIQTYYLLIESMDINNVYPYEILGKFLANFKDEHNIQHFIRIAYQPLNKLPDAYVVKFWFLDKEGKVSYERPNIIFDLKPDEKIFNTHIHILLKEFLEKQNFFEKIKPANKLYLPATDYARYRLYRMALNKFLDKTYYKLDDFDNKTLIIEKL